MDFTSVLQRSEPHLRTIIHLDMDYFYAQVEEIRNPTLRKLPLGIQQKNLVVTCNYVARSAGVKKLMLVEEAKYRCKNLVLVNGEDLTPYRQMSQRIFDLLLNYTPAVEKLGFDENFLDVSTLVEQRLATQTNPISMIDNKQVVGHIHPPNADLNACSCGCAARLAVGTQIAAEIREELKLRLELTCCAGIAYNKLLAKLVGAQNKPNQQTLLISTYSEQFMRDLNELQRVTGIGQKTQELLAEMGVSNVSELQACALETLRKKFGYETAKKLKELSCGNDPSAVRTSGKPKTIGLEDNCRPISLRGDVEERFKLLLRRLLEQVADDGRIPISIKVVLRKFDPLKKTSHRESKQANILPSLFCADTKTGKIMLAAGAQEKLLKIVMRLFERVVDLEKPFNITLIGLAFSKFQQRKVGSASIANYLIKTTDLEVQSITSLTHTPTAATSTTSSPTPSVCSNTSGDEAAFRSSPTTFQPSDQFYRRRATTASPIPMLVDNGSESGATNSDFSDFSETEVEPSPKKSRISRLLMHKRRCMGNKSCTSTALNAADVASPSKLRVDDLHLSPREHDQVSTSSTNCLFTSYPTTSCSNIQSQRFHTLQPHINRIEKVDINKRQPSLRQLSITSSMSCSSGNSSPVPSPLSSPMDESYSMSSNSTITTTAIILNSNVVTTTNSETEKTITNTIKHSINTNVPYPASVDPQVFQELPLDVQNELIASWRNSLAVAVNSATTLTTASTGITTTTTTTQSTTTTATATNVNASQKNTLYRYFLRNK